MFYSPCTPRALRVGGLIFAIGGILASYFVVYTMDGSLADQERFLYEQEAYFVSDNLIKGFASIVTPPALVDALTVCTIDSSGFDPEGAHGTRVFWLYRIRSVKHAMYQWTLANGCPN